jgi:hypothetical protein
MFYRGHVLERARADRPTLVAVHCRTSPVADGVIGSNEYGPGTTISWAEGNTLAAFQHERYSADGKSMWNDPTKS